MNLKQKIKNLPFLYAAILFLLNRVRYFNWQFHRRFPKYMVTPSWSERIAIVKESPDNEKLSRVANAGAILGDHQLMHNGLKITLGSYYDYGNTHLLLENKGVHEPQEELVFGEILKHIPSGAVMMELGSYWAFYSMWFAREVKNASCFMIEPDPHKMNFGKLNFKLNRLKGKFALGFIGDHPNLKPSIPLFSVDFLMKEFSIAHIHLLHSDIQGFELQMLDGCQEALHDGKIDYFFISTHSQQLHLACLEKLTSHHYLIVCEADLEQSYSVDGLIVAKRAGVPGPDTFEISKRTRPD